MLVECSGGVMITPGQGVTEGATDHFEHLANIATIATIALLLADRQ
jgi:hypothetical protein